jgi:hypothetical protein
MRTTIVLGTAAAYINSAESMSMIGLQSIKTFDARTFEGKLAEVQKKRGKISNGAYNGKS